MTLELIHPICSDDPEYVTRFEPALELARRVKSANVVGVQSREGRTKPGVSR